jgi:hypothetical protein
MEQQEQTGLVVKGGVLVWQAEALEDLTDIVRRERDQRVADLVRRAVEPGFFLSTEWSESRS